MTPHVPWRELSLSRFRLAAWAGLLALLTVNPKAARASAADAPANPDKTLSPYFVVEGADPNVEALPLESTKVDIQVTGVIAEITVQQAYKNAGTKPIHAQYVFPASTRAAVHGMRMQVGKQVVEAQIKERQQATKLFEAAKHEGKSASLLEQERPNVFTMKIANVMPGDRLDVTLRYSELLVPTGGVYELDYPTVVGPRYSNQREATAKPQSKFVATPYTASGTIPSYPLEIQGNVAAPIPLQAFACPSHALVSSVDSQGVGHFRLAPSESTGGNRDFILRYQLSGDQIQSGLSLFDSGGEKFFLLQVEPPKRVPSEWIPPREYVFIVDVSGSMNGFPLDTAKGLLHELIGGLRPSDQFNVLLFSGASALLAEHSLPATATNIALATAFINRQQSGGGTELLPALQRAFALTKSEGLSRSFLVVTDGYIEQDRNAIDLVRSQLSDANVFALGIGSSVNRFLIDGIAKAGAGEPFVVTSPAQAKVVTDRLREYVRTPVLTDVEVNYENFDAYDVEPKSFPDVMAERPIVIQGKYRGDAKGFVNLHGLTGKGPYAQRFDVSQVTSRPDNRALSFLWARSRVASLADYGFAAPSSSAKAEITEIGLRYNLLTDYTSFVAVAHQVVNPSGMAEDVDQPLPLPEGVSNSAIGQPETADEPELLVLLALVAVALALGSKRARGRIFHGEVAR